MYSLVVRKAVDIFRRLGDNLSVGDASAMLQLSFSRASAELQQS
jgi:hypothetical protein